MIVVRKNGTYHVERADGSYVLKLKAETYHEAVIEAARELNGFISLCGPGCIACGGSLPVLPVSPAPVAPRVPVALTLPAPSISHKRIGDRRHAISRSKFKTLTSEEQRAIIDDVLYHSLKRAKVSSWVIIARAMKANGPMMVPDVARQCDISLTSAYSQLSQNYLIFKRTAVGVYDLHAVAKERIPA
jgi:hypothetical protein